MFSFYQLLFGSLLITLSAYFDRSKINDQKETFPENPENFFLPVTEEFDFIIVGAGASGSILASRLSEKFKVLLLERGGDPPPMYEVPAFYESFKGHPDLYYIWNSVPDEETGKQVRTIQGKGLGGGSSVNALVYNRGHPKDYDLWAEITGDPIWKYENVLENFKKFEDCLSDDEICKDHYGKNPGMIGLEDFREVLNPRELEWVEIWNKAGEELGYSTRLDPNGPQKEGFSYYMTNKRNGRRESAYKVFLESNLNRKNLTVSKYSEAKKIEFDDQKRAIGVLYEKHGKLFYAKASKEVLISCGTFNTPLLLLRSGVGPADQLAENNVPLIQDLPVGQSLQDHPNLYSIKLYFNESKFINDGLSQNDIDYFINEGKGFLAQTFGYLGQAFLVSNVSKNTPGQEDWPDYQIDFMFDTEENFKGKELSIIIGSVLERQTSLGSLTLDPQNPDKNKLIWKSNFLDNQRDLDIFTESAMKIIEIAETKTFYDVGLRVDKSKIENCQDFEWGSYSYWECFVKHEIGANFHPSSSCPMGKIGDPRAVVDSKLRILGLKNIRIIDNSVQPQITNANLHAPALLLGQMGSQFIIEDYN